LPQEDYFVIQKIPPIRKENGGSAKKLQHVRGKKERRKREES